MERLDVLYDERCGLCRWARQWASTQPAFIPLQFIPAGSERAVRLFPGLDQSTQPEELIAVSDRGEVYRNESAWIMCLFALVEYREWANRLASPMLRPFARQAFTLVSKQRGNISRWLGLVDDHVLLLQLRDTETTVCELDSNAGVLEKPSPQNVSEQKPALMQNQVGRYPL